MRHSHHRSSEGVDTLVSLDGSSLGVVGRPPADAAALRARVDREQRARRAARIASYAQAMAGVTDLDPDLEAAGLESLDAVADAH